MNKKRQKVREKLLIARESEYDTERISEYKVGDIYEESFSTTSPPAEVKNTYEVTKIDNEGLWGKIIDNYIREYTGEEMR